jgi:hypothetical protein
VFGIAHDDRVVDEGVLGQYVAYLAQLNAQASEFDLLVAPAGVEQLPVAAPREDAGAEESLHVQGGEPVVGELGIIEIADGHPGPAQKAPRVLRLLVRTGRR